MTEIYVLKYPKQICGFYTSYSLAEEALCMEIQEGLEVFAAYCEEQPYKMAKALETSIKVVCSLQETIQKCLEAIKIKPSLETVKFIARHFVGRTELVSLTQTKDEAIKVAEQVRIKYFLGLLIIEGLETYFELRNIEIKRFELNEKFNYDLLPFPR
jgi:hypothetical protein